MTFSEVLLWIAGISWLTAIIPAIQRARAGDRSVLAYFALLAVVGVPLCLAFPHASAGILIGLWLVTVAAPALLLQFAQQFMRERRFGLALAACRLVPFCQPIGPKRAEAALISYQVLLEAGRTAEAERLAARRFPESVRHLVRLLALRAEQRWPEILDLCRDLPAEKIGDWHMRASAETGDFTGMLADFAKIADHLEGKRAQARQALATVLAFGGRPDLVADLMPGVAPAIRTFWIATATWAAGDEAHARELLAGIHDPRQPALESAIAWRLAHPPRAVQGLDAEAQQGLAAAAELAQPYLVRKLARPWCTWAIAVACAAAFIYTQQAEFPGLALWYAGAFDPALGWADNWWRFFAASFLHANFMHIAMNVYALLLIAPPMERALRWWRFLPLYLLTGASGMALVLILYQTGHGEPNWVVGASASIFGLIGAELVGHFRNRRPGEPWWRHKQIRRLGVVLAIQVFFDLSHPQVSQAGHIGGFLGGVVLALALVPRPARNAPGLRDPRSAAPPRSPQP